MPGNDQDTEKLRLNAKRSTLIRNLGSFLNLSFVNLLQRPLLTLRFLAKTFSPTSLGDSDWYSICATIGAKIPLSGFGCPFR